MSVVLLIDYGVTTGTWSAPAQVMIEYWDRAIGVLFTKLIPLAPMLEYVLHKLAEALDWKQIPELHPHWKHVFVLLMAIFTSFTKRTFFEGDYLLGSFGLSIGSLFALLSAFSVGLIPQNSSNFWANFLISAVPAILFWVAIYLVWLPKGGNTGHDLRDFLARSAVTLVAIGSAVFIFVRIDVIRNNVHIGLFCLMGFVIWVAVNRMYFGYRNAKKYKTSFFSDPLTLRGLTILSAFIGAAVFCMFSAGWTLVGS